jgi:hypothetical protein
MLQLQEVEDRKTPAATTWAAECCLREEESREFLGFWITSGARESALFIGTRFSNLYTAVDTPAEAAYS